MIMNEKAFGAIFGGVIGYLEGLTSEDGSVGLEKLISSVCNSIRVSQAKIENRYAEINQHTKDDFMKLVEGEEIRLDRHKCAAAFMIAFLEKSDINAENTAIPTMRERLAIRIGLSIMLTMIKDMNDKTVEDTEKDSAFAVFLTNNKDRFQFPKILNGTNSYEKNWELELYFANKDNKLFILSMANELFCIEKYNRILSGEKENSCGQLGN